MANEDLRLWRVVLPYRESYYFAVIWAYGATEAGVAAANCLLRDNPRQEFSNDEDREKWIVEIVSMAVLTIDVREEICRDLHTLFAHELSVLGNGRSASAFSWPALKHFMKHFIRQHVNQPPLTSAAETELGVFQIDQPAGGPAMLFGSLESVHEALRDVRAKDGGYSVTFL